MSTDNRWAIELRDIQKRAPIQSRAREMARSAYLTASGLLARSREASFLRCLYLHYVYDDQVDAFRSLLNALRKIGDFVSADDAVAMARGEKPIMGRHFHISLDDGFDNVYRNAFPVFSELGIQATLFVPSAFVGADDRSAWEMWWMHDSAPMPTRPLRWDQLQEMSRAGHTVGSHTRTHARLSDISGDAPRLSREVADSRHEIEDRLGVPCSHISWPFGTAADVDGRALAAIEEAGYDGCFSAVRGRVVPGRTSRFEIPRHHFEPDWPWPHVRYFALGGRE